MSLQELPVDPVYVVLHILVLKQSKFPSRKSKRIDFLAFALLFAGALLLTDDDA